MKAKSTLNFQLSEFECPCCGENKITGALVTKLQSLRDMINMPIHITSGYRCAEYNKKIGGYSDSPHIKGKACDITANIPIWFLAKMAKEVGFTRVGLYPNNGFIHIDLMKPSPSASWIRRGGVYTYYKTLEEAIKNYGNK